MENHLLKLAGAREEILAKCPKCGSNEVVLMKSKEGFYEVFECNKCGYKNPNKML